MNRIKGRMHGMERLMASGAPQVDLVEPVAHFLARARADLRPEDGDVTMSSSSPAAGAASEAASTGSHVATNFYCMPLQVRRFGEPQIVCCACFGLA